MTPHRYWMRPNGCADTGEMVHCSCAKDPAHRHKCECTTCHYRPDQDDEGTKAKGAKAR